MKIMYGLFRMTYDYYEWENISAVSEDRQKLVDLYEEIKTINDPEPLADEEEHKRLANGEVYHYLIKPVRVV